MWLQRREEKSRKKKRQSNGFLHFIWHSMAKMYEANDNKRATHSTCLFVSSWSVVQIYVQAHTTQFSVYNNISSRFFSGIFMLPLSQVDCQVLFIFFVIFSMLTIIIIVEASEKKNRLVNHKIFNWLGRCFFSQDFRSFQSYISKEQQQLTVLFISKVMIIKGNLQFQMDTLK